jgi:predicted phosphodiesterase
MSDSKPKKILEFLDTIKTDVLILNGDIIDIDALNRGSKWKNKHMKVVIKLLDMSRNTEIIYIRGNHDNDVKELFSSGVGNIKFMDEYIYNVEDKKYPPLYVTAGLNDPRVSYHEPAKWVAKLRSMQNNTSDIFFRCEMGAGHGGPSGRYEHWRDEAHTIAFMLQQLPTHSK